MLLWLLLKKTSIKIFNFFKKKKKFEVLKEEREILIKFFFRNQEQEVMVLFHILQWCNSKHEICPKLGALARYVKFSMNNSVTN